MKSTGRMLRHIRKTASAFLVALLLLIPYSLSAVEAFTEGTGNFLPIEGEPEEPVREPDKPALFFTVGPVGMLNTDKLSAPSPIQFSAGVGGTIPVNTWFAFSPSLNLFTTYYLWRNDGDGGRAYPAEIENRTGLAPSALIDLPAVFYAQSGNSTFSFGLGITLFCRYAFLADSVPQSESGDIDSMNSFFYSGLRFLYPSAHFAYDFKTESGMKAGIVLKAWAPLDSLMNDRGLDGGMATISFRITLAGKTEEETDQTLR